VNASRVFDAANLGAGLAWLFLLGPARWMPRTLAVVRLAVPALFAVAYTVVLAAAWPWQGGFGSLAELSRLFENDWVLLAGWIHYLAFDFFVGGWILANANELGLRHWLVVLVLAFTFMFGPVGYLAFFGIRSASQRGRSEILPG
jgi:hypothetical protein